jgi:hypothetical protein
MHCHVREKSIYPLLKPFYRSPLFNEWVVAV